jgi:hypothetical protein
MMTGLIYMGLRYVAPNGDDEITIGDGLTLAKPNPLYLNARWPQVMSQLEIEDEATASRYLVCKYPVPDVGTDDWEANQQGMNRFRSGVMAFQIIKPAETLGFIYYGKTYIGDAFSINRVERHPKMDGRQWARMKNFEPEMLARVPDMIRRVQAVLNADNAERKNAVTFLQLGLETSHPYISGLLCVMGLEALFDSDNRNDFKTKLCDCLGPTTLAFPDWNTSTVPPPYTVEDIAIPLYMLRNKLAHGVDLRKAASDKSTPVDLTAKVTLTEHSGPTAYSLVLSQAAIFLLCQVLEKVL